MSNGDTPTAQPQTQPAAAPEIKVEALAKIEGAEIGKKDLARVNEADKKTREDGRKIVTAEVKRVEETRRVEGARKAG